MIIRTWRTRLLSRSHRRLAGCGFATLGLLGGLVPTASAAAPTGTPSVTPSYRTVSLPAPRSPSVHVAPIRVANTATVRVQQTGLAKPPVPASGAYLGGWINPEKSQVSPNSFEIAQLPAFESAMGRRLAVVSVYQQWRDPISNNILATLAYNGSIPMISWKCGDTDANINAGDDDEFIEAYAHQIARYGLPVLLRWFYEMNRTDVSSAKTPWVQCIGSTSADNGNPAAYAQAAAGYVAAYQRIYTIFQMEGATNAAFVWNVSMGAGSSQTQLQEFYPGNAYVDWIGADGYNRNLGTKQNLTTFGEIFNAWYVQFSTSAYNKPLLIGETGAAQGHTPANAKPPNADNQQTYIQATATVIPASYPNIKLLDYFDTDATYNYILRYGTPGFAAFTAMARLAYFGVPAPVPPPVACVGVRDTTDIGNPAAMVAMTTGPCTGYWTVTQQGAVATFGAASWYGDPRAEHLNAPIIAMAATPDDGGYWLLGADGGIFSYGDAKFYGSTGSERLNAPIVGISATATGDGYWLVAKDGGIFSFGDAVFYGSTGSERLNQPVVGMSATEDGGGYWLVASDGGIFSFGDAPFLGSTGSIRLNQPVIAMTADPGGGYRLVASDGGIFSFGAAFYGSLGSLKLNAPIVNMAESADGNGYYMLAADGGVFAFGDATYFGRVLT